MSTQVLRPIFNENQILSAADVNSIVNHGRDADARHYRYLHSWGIAEGLKLQEEKREDPAGPYVEVSVTPGVAIDGNGREIVVTEGIRLSEDTFDQLNVAQSNPELKYPVFLLGRDRPLQASAIAPSVCHSGEPTRTEEGFEITFGRVGDAAELETQTPIPVRQGISVASFSAWKILLGYVKWDGNHFNAIAEEDGGVGRRYVGVNAEDVSAQNDRLTLRSADRKISDKAALVIDNENDGEMRFGLQDNNGKVVPVFTVNAKGDVIAEGKIIGAIAGGVQVESGVITDGALVPLPAGITQQQIDDGEATIQVHLHPRFEPPPNPILPAPTAGEHWTMHPLECYADGRRVFCRVLWQETRLLAADFPITNFVLPGICDYQVFGFVKEKGVNA